MTATAHAVIGTVIATKIGNPAFAIPIALVSHLVADAIPHWDTATHLATKGQKRAIFDSFLDLMFGFAVSFILIVFVFPNTNLNYAFFLILVSQSPDWLMVPYRLMNINFFLFRWAYQFQKLFDHPLDKPWGIIIQTIVLILVILLAKIF